MPTQYRFDRFRVDPQRRQLWDGRTPLALGARAFDLLLALLEQPARALSRDELFARAWPDRVVGDENLKMQVMALRRTLGAALVVTVPRVGYRIGCEVKAIDGEADEAPAPDQAAADAPPPELIGRDDAWHQARAALARQRLLTLTGPGGVGKTRLALALAAAEAPRHADGVLVLALADHGEGSSLPLLLTRAARLADSPAQADAEGLARALRTLALLVVLDNCEHLLPAVRELAAALLRHAPRVRILATSQQPLALADEQRLPLAPLAALSPDGGPGPAMQLFAARAARVDPGFCLDAERLPQVAQICTGLDGLPLAIELAAARVPLLGVAGLRSRLHAPLALLAGGGAAAEPRHRTLRDALRWSVDLLDEAERRLFVRLGIFVGGFDLDAAVALDTGGDEFATIERLSSLVARSLVQVDDAGAGKRYRLLEVARAFALETLAADGALAAARRDHAGWVARRFDEADSRAFGQPLLVWTAPLMPDLPNLRAALVWALSDEGLAAEPQLAARLLAVGTVPWAVAGIGAEADRLLAAAAERLALAPPALAARGWLAVANRGVDYSMPAATALAAARRALEGFRACGDAVGTYRSLAQVIQQGQRSSEPIDVDALLAEMRALEQPHWTPMQRRSRRWPEARQLWRRDGDWVAYREAFLREVRACREAGNAVFAWQAAHNVVLAEIVLGRAQEAVELARTVADEIRAAGLERQQWPTCAVHAMACICTGDPALSVPALRAVLPLLRLADSVWWLGDHLAWWLAQVGRFEAAARAEGWIEARRQARGETASPQALLARAALDALLQARLDPGLRATLADAGRGDIDDDVAQAVLLALETAAPH